MKIGRGLILVVTALTVLLTGCSGRESNEIVVVSREDGSGTRGAFIELFGIEEKDADGNKVDHTTDEATVVNSTSITGGELDGRKKATQGSIPHR